MYGSRGPAKTFSTHDKVYSEYIHIHTYIHTYVCMYSYFNTNLLIFYSLWSCTQAYVQMCIITYMYRLKHIIHVYTELQTDTHIHTHTRKLVYNWSFLFEVLHKTTLLPSTFKGCDESVYCDNKSEIIWNAWKDVAFDALIVWKWGFVKTKKVWNQIKIWTLTWSHPCLSNHPNQILEDYYLMHE